MKYLTYLLLPLFLCLATSSFAQQEETALPDDTDTAYAEDYEEIAESRNGFFQFLDTPRGQLGLYLATSPFIRQQSFGGGFDVQGWFTNNYALGLSLVLTGRKVDPKFGYDIGEARLVYYDISLFQELMVYQQKRMEAGIRLYTGVSVFSLSDNSIMETVWVYDENGYGYEVERPLPIASNIFFKVAPAFVLRYRVAKNIHIEGNAGYNFLIGRAKYGTRGDFNNYILQLGIKVDVK
jgi:hypothetical protein